ncbi:uncharacterized protein [Argopecten irradians]|uniref:uncharacterized protein n=1 Tax=Argopecten irradians TaxID=31199 RepID=UPI003716643A
MKFKRTGMLPGRHQITKTTVVGVLLMNFRIQQLVPGLDTGQAGQLVLKGKDEASDIQIVEVESKSQGEPKTGRVTETETKLKRKRARENERFGKYIERLERKVEPKNEASDIQIVEVDSKSQGEPKTGRVTETEMKLKRKRARENERFGKYIERLERKVEPKSECVLYEFDGMWNEFESK